jgi:F0F1-type ATP synthase assembly protein I
LPTREDRPNAWRSVAPYLGLGTQLAVTVVLFVLLGLWLDDEWDTNPWMTVAGALVGAGAGMYNFIRAALQAGKDDREDA